MKQLSTGTGLAVLGLSAIACVLLSNTKLGTPAQASSTPAVATVAAAALTQTAPTIVWYGVSSNAFNSYNNEKYMTTLARAWSDGRMEIRRIRHGYDLCSGDMICETPWVLVSDANQGYAAFADLDLNHEVDGGDLSMVLLNYGDAPRQDIPPSDCPLNLINPR
jgi:hypothetical protein